MAEDQGRGAAFIMAQIGVHVRAANAHAVNLDKLFAGTGHGGFRVAKLKVFRAGIHKRFHFAVYPPSTMRT